LQQPVDEDFADRRVLVRQTTELHGDALVRRLAAVRPDLDRAETAEGLRAMALGKLHLQLRKGAFGVAPAGVAAERDANAVHGDTLPARLVAQRAGDGVLGVG